MRKPQFDKLWHAFPDHAAYRTLEDLYTALGGAAKKNIHVPGFGPNGNTCASRMSVALNQGGAPVDMSIVRAVGAQTLGTANDMRIMYRVSDLRNYFRRLLGQPGIDDTSPYDDAFHGRRGIIAFSVNWAGATGHVALWNGSTYREPTYDDYASYVDRNVPSVRTFRGEFWELP